MNSLAHRTAAITIAALVLLGAAACGSGGADTGGSATAGSSSGADSSASLTEAKAEVNVLLSNLPLKAEPLSSAPPKGLKVASVTCTLTSCKPGEFAKAAAKFGWKASEQTYDLSKGPSDFVAAVRRALQTRPDALAILFAHPPELIKAEIQQAQNQGVTLIDIASAVDAPPQGFAACIACNAALYADGKAEADFVAVDAGAQTSVGVVGDKTIDANVSATKGFVEKFESNSPNSTVHVINVSFAKSPQANAQTVVSALQRNPDIKYLVVQSPDFLSGMSQALSAAGLSQKVKVVALDPAGEEQLALVKGGGVYAWVGADGPVIWWRAVDAIARHEVGQDFDPTPIPALRVITQGNMGPGMFAPRDYETAYDRAWQAGS
ncbi:sugar ABC transporter substrate-binding protein [Streptomyces plumbiresistens]